MSPNNTKYEDRHLRKQKQIELYHMTEELKLQIRALKLEASVMVGAKVDENSEDDFVDDMKTLTVSDHEFDSKFKPGEMKCLALVAHDNMKPAMKKFVLDNKNVLKKFRLTGTKTTVAMLKELFREDCDMQYGPAVQSGPIGGDAELCHLMGMGDIGGMIFLQDPIHSHAHQADIDCLLQFGLIYNILVATNPCSGYALTAALRLGLRKGKKRMLSSFFQTRNSTGVEYHNFNVKPDGNEISSNENKIQGCSSSHSQINQDTLDQAISNDTGYGNFFSKFNIDDMRCLVLVASDRMKAAMESFLLHHKNTLRKFRLTGTPSTMAMVRHVMRDEPLVKYGPTVQAGPFGEYAGLGALMSMEEVGGIVFLQDPFDNRPNQADIACLTRLANVHDIFIANNLISANTMMIVLRQCLKKGNQTRISSFFGSNLSPSVVEYKRKRQQLLQR